MNILLIGGSHHGERMDIADSLVGRPVKLVCWKYEEVYEPFHYFKDEQHHIAYKHGVSDDEALALLES